MSRRQLSAILVVHPDRHLLSDLREALGAAGYRVLAASTAALARELLSGLHVRLVLAADRLPDGSGLALLEDVHRTSPWTAQVLLGDELELEGHPTVFGCLSDRCSQQALLGMVSLALRQAQLDAAAALLGSTVGPEMASA